MEGETVCPLKMINTMTVTKKFMHYDSLYDRGYVILF